MVMDYNIESKGGRFFSFPVKFQFLKITQTKDVGKLMKKKDPSRTHMKFI